MSFHYRTDILAALKNAGYTTYKIRQDKLFNETVLQNFRDGKMVSWKVLDKVCDLLKCQPGDLIEHIPNE